MTEKQMLTNVTEMLQRRQFSVQIFTDAPVDLCFEIFGSKRINLLVKVAQNIDLLNKSLLRELSLLSYVLSAVPIIIGKQNRREPLLDGIIYLREHILAMSETTFKNLISGIKHIFGEAQRGRYVVDIDGEKLKTARNAQNISQKALGEMIGVSSKTIRYYESSEMKTKVEIAEKLEKILKVRLRESIDMLQDLEDQVKMFEISQDQISKIAMESKKQAVEKKNKEFRGQVEDILEDIGFSVVWPSRVPFDAFVYEADKEVFDKRSFHFMGCKYELSTATPISMRGLFTQTFIHHKFPNGGLILDDNTDEKPLKLKHIPYVKINELDLIKDPKTFQKLLLKRANWL